MTEARPKTRVTMDAPTQSGALGASSKLRPTAKEFVFNKAAPVWTPSVAPVTSQLKLSAKPFVPSCKNTSMHPLLYQIP
ncbi:hypothetical protein DD237_006827 [Peronospora effusa]|uniref:Uncharacterized protein n=1 Tax=Peronospora effusa TaxID=542832 RepID=A0A3R8CSM3_9STRA|nr:hypothetical protein DD237_006827 [Peronospora effusa]